MAVFQFIGAFLGASVVVVTLSLLWPKITRDPQPEPLRNVRDVVMETEAGQNLANVLGVIQDGSTEPVSLQGLAASAAQAVVSSVVTHTQQTVATKLLESLGQKFNELPVAEQERFRTMICQPQETPVPTPSP